MAKKLVFTGSGSSSGNGWDYVYPGIDTSASPDLWTNLCHQNIHRLQNLDMVNVSKKNATNIDIFQQTIKVIADYGEQIDVIFCQWALLFKYEWNVGFELWPTTESVVPTFAVNHDVNLNNNKTWTREYIKNQIVKFLELHHVHWEIVKIIQYSNIILKLANRYKIPVFFINESFPWDKDYFVELSNVKPNEYTEFTKKEILNVDNRDDEDIFELYKLAHQHYREAGGVDQKNWINLYDSFFTNQVDKISVDNPLGGVKSNKIYYKIIEQRLKELNFI
jgi:hypothetical protein